MIFISHKTDPDHAAALRIAEILRKNRINCWLAPESIEGGADFAMSVTQAINSCEIFLLVLTENTGLSAHVRKEVTLANSHSKRIIPLKIGEFDIDDSMQYHLADVQIVPFSFEDKDIEERVRKCSLGERAVEMEVGKNPSRKVTLIKGGFQENMDFLLKERPEVFGKTVFAVGIDSSSRLDISSRKGILRWVCKYLREEFGITTAELQALVNEAKRSQLGHRTDHEPMRYKDIVVIRVPLGPSEGEPAVLKLLLAANSSKKPDFAQTQDLEALEGIDSREIIISIFSKCREMEDDIENLCIGAIGTNGLKFPYEVSISEILNCYVYAQRMMVKPRNLYLSVRSEDMARAGLTVEDILSYIMTVVHFMRK